MDASRYLLALSLDELVLAQRVTNQDNHSAYIFPSFHFNVSMFNFASVVKLELLYKPTANYLFLFPPKSKNLL